MVFRIMPKRMVALIISFMVFTSIAFANNENPNIIFIMADDLGWNDVGFHGSNEIPTPNIDALAYSGLILNNYYVNPICTPSRSALMTGKYPIHTGMQHQVLYGAEPRGLSLEYKILPQYLKDLGYSNHIVGKWHLGSYKKEYTPLYRGFESHLGFWTGHHDYFDHTAMETNFWGLDMRRNMDVAWNLHGKYSTEIFTGEAVNIISNHNLSKPLFLYLAHAAVHSSNPYSPLPAPDNYVARFSHINNYERRRFAAVLTLLDESVGEVVAALLARKMLENSIIIFSTDNGGPAAGFNLNAASNWPLRGVKNTLWEGGVRGAALIWSSSITASSRVATQMMQVADWLPTLYSAAGGNATDLGNIDGMNQWKPLTNNEPSPRNDVLHNIDDISGSSALTVGEWKIVKGTNYNGEWDSWYGPSGRTGTYNLTKVLTSKTGNALKLINRAANEATIIRLRQEATVECPIKHKNEPCNPLIAPCLFNIQDDPCETNDLSKLFPDVLNRLLDDLNAWNKTAIAPKNLPIDPRGNPQFWDHTWTNFGDHFLIINITYC